MQIVRAKPQLHVLLYNLFQFCEISTFDLRVLNVEDKEYRV